MSKETVLVWFEPTILTQGFHVVNKLKKLHPEVTIKAGVNDPNHELVGQELDPGVATVVKVDAFSQDSIKAALEGVDKVVIIPPNTENKAVEGIKIVNAIDKNKVKFVALFSMLGANRTDPHAIIFQKQFHEIEQALEKHGVPYTFVRSPGFDFEFFPHYLDEIKKTGKFEIPMENNTGPLIGMDALSEVIITALFPKPGEAPLDPNTSWITGPKDESGAHMALCLSYALKPLNIKVTYENSTPARTLEIFKAIGFRDYEAERFTELLVMLGGGTGAKITDQAAHFIGHPQNDFAHFAVENFQKRHSRFKDFVDKFVALSKK